MMSGVRLVILAGALGSAAVLACAQPPPAINADLVEFIGRLDSPDARLRIEATEAILQSPAISLKQIESALRAGTLSPEQRQRLLGVAARRFRTEPRAAMGIQNDGNLGSHGVSLAFLQPGFPAAQVLKIGDRIIAAAGQTIDTWETMRAVILSRDPGDEIPVTVVREGATLNLAVTLGDFGRLRQPSGLDPIILGEAWRIRCRGLDHAESEPIPSGLPVAAWAAPFNLLPGEAADMGLARPANDAGISLVAGGEARGGIQGPVQPPIVQRNFNLRGIPGENRFNPVPGPLVVPQDPAALAQQQELLRLTAMLQDRRAQLESVMRQFSDPTIPADDRRLIRGQVEAITTQIQGLTERIRRLDMQLNPRRVR